MKAMDLNDWLARIQRVHPVDWDLGLERVGRVGKVLGIEHPGEKVVLVAGTNGKGSTCQYLSDMARAAGLTVGASTSPHLFQFNERIVIDGQPVADSLIVEAFEAIEAARGETSLTYFEFSSLASMLIFQWKAVDLSILEVGLGGRLDAMNIVNPDLCIITSIDLDHETWLGDTREAIGLEKAGILRPGIPLVLADPVPPESVMCQVEKLNVPLLALGRDFFVPESLECSLPSPSYAAARQAAQLLDLGLSDDQLTAIAGASRLLGRKTWVKSGCNYLLDVAHNPAAARLLADYLGSLQLSGDAHALLGIYADKNIAGVTDAFKGLFSTWHLTDLSEERAASSENVAAELPDEDAGKIYTYANISTALKTVQRMAKPDDLVVVFGSFATVAGAIEYLDEQQIKA